MLAVTFFAFGTAQISFLQLFGIGTGIAIVLDATVTRGLLVPAFMRLAGDLNWWSPSVLRRLYQRIGLAETAIEPPNASVAVTIAAGGVDVRGGRGGSRTLMPWGRRV